MNPTPRKTDDKTQKAIDEFLANGGEIKYCRPGERTEDIQYTGGFYQKRKKKKEDEENKSK